MRGHNGNVIVEGPRDPDVPRPWWFRPGIAGVLIGGLFGIVLSEPAPLPAPDVAVRDSIEKFSRLMSYHKDGVAMYLDSTTGQRRSREIAVDIQRPGRTRVVWNSDAPPLQSTEFLEVDNHLYERRPSEAWFENVFRPPDPSGLQSGRSPLGEPWAVVDRTLMREVDRPRIDDQPTRHIRYGATPALIADAVFAAIGVDTRGAATSGLDLRSSVEVWIRTADSQIVRVRYALIVGTADEYSFQESYSQLDEAPRFAIIAPATAGVRSATQAATAVSTYLAATSAGNESAALEVWHISANLTPAERERRIAVTHELASQRVGRYYTIRTSYFAVPWLPAPAEQDARGAWVGVIATDAAGNKHDVSFLVLVNDFPMLMLTPAGPANTWTVYDVVPEGQCGAFVC